MLKELSGHRYLNIFSMYPRPVWTLFEVLSDEEVFGCYDSFHISSWYDPRFQNTEMFPLKGCLSGTSLLVQCLRTHLPRQGTWVRSLVWEDPICQGATEPASHSYCGLPSRSHDYGSPHTSKNLRSATGKVTAKRSLRTTLERSPSSRRSEGPCSTEHPAQP